MNAFTLSYASIISRPLNAALCVLAGALGIALLCLFGLLSQAISDGFSRNAQGIDIVAGAKGSPLQLVLSSVYQADVPTGNIEAADYEALVKNPQIKSAIPLTLGDNYKGWRIVGATPAYVELYDGRFAQGKIFDAPFEAVAGASTGLRVGEEFAGAHGFSADSDDVHDSHLYTITGVLKPTGTVLDRVIVTSYKSVQQLHAPHAEEGHARHAHDDDESPEEHAAEEAIAHQVTAVLIQTRNKLGVINLPRTINRSSNIQAAAPAYEITRLARNLGVGRDLMMTAGAAFVVLSGLMLLSSLVSSLSLRRYDLSVLRVLGATPLMLARIMVTEALILAAAGTIAGIAAGHLAAYGAAMLLPSLQGLVVPSSLLMPQTLDALLLALGLGSGILAASVPALLAARTDIADILARGRG